AIAEHLGDNLDAGQVAQGRHTDRHADAQAANHGVREVTPVTPGAAAVGHGLLAVLLPRLVELVREDLVGFIPGDALPLALAALADALHRVAQAARVILVLDGRQPLRAQRSPVGRGFRVALNLDHAPIPHVDERAARAVTHTTHRANDFGLFGELDPAVGLFQPLKVWELQRGGSGAQGARRLEEASP